MISVKLSQPVEVKTGSGPQEIDTLELREPTVKDVKKLGYPFQITINNGTPGVLMLPNVVLDYASALSGTPPSTLDKISLSYRNFWRWCRVFSGM
jgi:hypothetical protein